MLDKNTNTRHFYTTVGYIFSQNLCIVTRRFLVEKKNSALLCFLDGFGIVVRVFSY